MATFTEIQHAAEYARRRRNALEQRLAEAEKKLADRKKYVLPNLGFLQQLLANSTDLDQRKEALSERISIRGRRLQAIQDRIQAGKVLLEELETLARLSGPTADERNL